MAVNNTKDMIGHLVHISHWGHFYCRYAFLASKRPHCTINPHICVLPHCLNSLLFWYWFLQFMKTSAAGIYKHFEKKCHSKIHDRQIQICTQTFNSTQFECPTNFGGSIYQSVWHNLGSDNSKHHQSECLTLLLTLGWSLN